jgi:hypothetical protein
MELQARILCFPIFEQKPVKDEATPACYENIIPVKTTRLPAVLGSNIASDLQRIFYLNL